ncbi:MAG: hypothetical protein MHPSP_004298, partial [Paramarteilia canceri]
MILFYNEAKLSNMWFHFAVLLLLAIFAFIATKIVEEEIQPYWKNCSISNFLICFILVNSVGLLSGWTVAASSISYGIALKRDILNSNETITKIEEISVAFETLTFFNAFAVLYILCDVLTKEVSTLTLGPIIALLVAVVGIRMRELSPEYSDFPIKYISSTEL